MSTLDSIFGFLILIAVGGASATVVSPCENGEFPDEVIIANCTQQPCTFYLNTDTSMTMKFKSPRRLEKIAPNALASVMGLNVNYPLDQSDACVGITNTQCPLDEGEEVEYTYGMTLLPIFPEVDLTLEFSIIDKEQNDAKVKCFKVDIQVRKKTK